MLRSSPVAKPAIVATHNAGVPVATIHTGIVGVLFLVPVSREPSYLHGLTSYAVLVSLAFWPQAAL